MLSIFLFLIHYRSSPLPSLSMFDPIAPPKPNLQQIASEFYRLGWIGFWAQLGLGIIPIVILLFVLLFDNTPNSVQVGSSWLATILAYGCLFALIFTIYWCFHYTQLSDRLGSREVRPSKAQIRRSLWIGILANMGGMTCAILVALWRVGTLLFRMLSLPPGASTLYTPVPGTAVVNPGSIIVPMNMIALQAMINTIAAELVGLGVTLWLLYRVLQHTAPRES